MAGVVRGMESALKSMNLEKVCIIYICIDNVSVMKVYKGQKLIYLFEDMIFCELLMAFPKLYSKFGSPL